MGVRVQNADGPHAPRRRGNMIRETPMRAIFCAMLIFPIVATAASAAPRYEPRLRDWLSNCSQVTGTQSDIIQAPSTAQRRVCVERLFHEADGVLAGMTQSKVRPWICMPDEAGMREQFAVIRKYINDHPEAMSANLGTVVAAALAEAYPCH